MKIIVTPSFRMGIKILPDKTPSLIRRGKGVVNKI
jgi:hypothetical protein